MVLTETKLRSVVREELHQYLIEEGFFDKIKSGFQRLTGRGQTQQPSEREQALARLLAQSPVGVSPVIMSDKEIADEEKKEQQGSTSTIQAIQNSHIMKMMRGEFIPITSERYLSWVIDRLTNRLTPNQSLEYMFTHLLLSMQYRVGKKAMGREKQIYGDLLNKIATIIEQELKATIQENERRVGMPLSDQEIYNYKKMFLISADLWEKTATDFYKFISDTLVKQRNLKLIDLFKDDYVLNSFVSLREFLGMKPFPFETTLREMPKSETKQIKKSISPTEEPTQTGITQTAPTVVKERKTFKRKK